MIHILNATFYSVIIVLTEGSQKILAEMYALGLVASFTINMGSLLYYRYFTGTKEIRACNTSRFGTLVLFIILISCFIYLAMSKPYGIALWRVATVFFLVVGIRVARKRAPEIEHVAQTDTPDADGVRALPRLPAMRSTSTSSARWKERISPTRSVAYVTFYSPRQGIPQRVAPNHYRFAQSGQSLFDSITELLYVLKYELPHKQVTIHIGWPRSSWLDRLSIGVMVFSMMKLPDMFPEFHFVIEYSPRKPA